ncbi:hypothetical protein AV530_004493 [Patagioenas fasciata monilis]|uniref:Uncharacterized protein n=1 Tax=Patagioenas fasciata monilis TaxID=372326 RepID=A0A1V4JCE5_PATFA|nr:hypothetical protein AV530_004493 [Patagioenas fasciata monilis]
MSCNSLHGLEKVFPSLVLQGGTESPAPSMARDPTLTLFQGRTLPLPPAPSSPSSGIKSHRSSERGAEEENSRKSLFPPGIY